MKKILSFVMVLCMMFCFSANAFAEETEQNIQPSVTVEEIAGVYQSDTGNVETRGVTPPSNTWDLSKEDYSGSFNFKTNIFTNNKFSNHDGNIYVTLYSKFDEDDTSRHTTYTNGNYMEVKLCKKNLLGNTVYESTVKVEIGKSWIVSFTNWDPNTEYYIGFSQPDGQSSWYVDGNFTVSKTKH